MLLAPAGQSGNLEYSEQLLGESARYVAGSRLRVRESRAFAQVFHQCC